MKWRFESFKRNESIINEAHRKNNQNNLINAVKNDNHLALKSALASVESLDKKKALMVAVERKNSISVTIICENFKENEHLSDFDINMVEAAINSGDYNVAKPIISLFNASQKASIDWKLEIKALFKSRYLFDDTAKFLFFPHENLLRTSLPQEINRIIIQKLIETRDISVTRYMPG